MLFKVLLQSCNLFSEGKLLGVVMQVNWGITLRLAFQSIGVVYGDMGTSPLYVYASTFTDENGIKETDDLIGVLSLIIYTIILIPLVKYAFIVLWANDNGDGEFIYLASSCLFLELDHKNTI